MCGIAGVVGVYEFSDIVQMLNATKHRGPDDTGYYRDENMAMGMNRLSIIDLSDNSNQPQISENGRYVIVFNGEIYNYQGLKSTLQSYGYFFRTNSDTEVILVGYIHYGKEILKQLRGMFAFAIWDRHENSLFIAKDHLGVKPLLYSELDGNFYFCSEIKGFLSTSCSGLKKLSMNAVHNFISLGHQVAPNTILENVKSLLPGHFIIYKKGKLEIQEFWDLSIFEPDHSLNSYEKSVSTLKDLVIKSVEEELNADVPVGIFLSGGLDSGILTAAARTVVNGGKLNTFTLGFEQKHGELDELVVSRKVAEYFKTSHHEVLINSNSAGDMFDDFISAIDQPSRDGLNSYIVSKYASKGIKVALSGLGGDELFVGYNGMFKYLESEQFDFEIQDILKIYSPLSRISHRLHNKLYSETSKLNFIQNYIVNLQPHLDLHSSRLFNFRLDSNLLTHQTISENYKFGNESMNRIRAVYLQLFMSNMLLRDSDSVAMMNSLEVRFPLIDIRLVEFALQMPNKFLIKDPRPGINRNYLKSGLKQMLFHAFEKDLPVHLYNQEKKGFQLPIYEWLRTAFKGKLEDTVFNPSELFNKRELVITYNHGDFSRDKTKELWSILILDQWLKKNDISFV